jgi:hypothetical protein
MHEGRDVSAPGAEASSRKHEINVCLGLVNGPCPQKRLNENLNYPFFVNEPRAIIKTISKLSWALRCNVSSPLVTRRCVKL